MDALDALIEEQSSWESVAARNEATTRLHLIDCLLFDCLGWPRRDVVSEHPRDGGYADYFLGKPVGRLILEAKREGVYFELPVGFDRPTARLDALMESSPATEQAVRQALGYCQTRGIPIGAICNGTQLIAFIASRQDGVAPLDGRALVFDSLETMRKRFRELWDNLSEPGLEALTMYQTLHTDFVKPPPAKLAARLADYPGFKNRNDIQTGLKILGDLILQDTSSGPEVEEEFLRQCYSSSGALSKYALVGREILRARYSAIFEAEAQAKAAPARTTEGVSAELTADVLSAGLSRRPLILLGDVGVGKSMFIRHFMRIDAKDLMEKSIVLKLDFGGEPALSTDLKDYVTERFVEQLLASGLDIEDRKFVQKVYSHDLTRFERGIYAELKKRDPDAYLSKELAMLEKKLSSRDRHLQASLKYASRNMHRQIVVFLDNIDQREFEFQEQVFLIGQSLAETWPATVFISLRPETFYRSRAVGSLTAYQPRVFTIAPPAIDEVIQKRLAFSRAQLSEWERQDSFPAGLKSQAATLDDYLQVLQASFSRNRELIELVENLAGGNVRAALGFLTTFVGSGHVDTRKALRIFADSGRYYVALHEFLRAIIYGDYEHYDPDASPIANLFEISSPDGREHFLLPIILAFVERVGEVGGEEGFVGASRIYEMTQALGFTPQQTEFALAHGLRKRLLMTSPYDPADNARRRYRITTVGAYTYRRLMALFVYLDAVVVDTPIVDPSAESDVADRRFIADRLDRAQVFLDYLDAQWAPLKDSDQPFDWASLSDALHQDIERIRHQLDVKAARGRGRPRRGRALPKR